MRDEKRAERQKTIEAAAYALLAEHGYDGISMLKIAKRAKASNETLYRWYGDKKGLFQALVRRNAEVISLEVEALERGEHKPDEILEALGPKLLKMLLSEQAIALNRAAAADPTGELGRELAAAGRETVVPLIIDIFEKLLAARKLETSKADRFTDLYIRLLVGDLQVRMVTGALTAFSEADCLARSKEALADLDCLLASATSASKKQ